MRTVRAIHARTTIARRSAHGDAGALLTAIACVAAALVLYAIMALLVGVSDDDDSPLGWRGSGMTIGAATGLRVELDRRLFGMRPIEDHDVPDEAAEHGAGPRRERLGVVVLVRRLV